MSKLTDTGWKQHTVVSKNCISIWNCGSTSLAVLPRKVMEKIRNDYEKRRPDKKNTAE